MRALSSSMMTASFSPSTSLSQPSLGPMAPVALAAESSWPFVYLSSTFGFSACSL